MLPLEGLLVLELGGSSAGSFAALRLADLGARVIKIDAQGEFSSALDSLERNKERYAMDYALEEDRFKLRDLIAKADIVLASLSPGHSMPQGFDYETVRWSNARLIYASLSGYGSSGPWVQKSSDDLFVQALSGLPWLNGDADDPPIPFPVSVVEMFGSANLVQGILAALHQRAITGSGLHVEVNLLESALDFQFEVLTTHLNDGGKLPERSGANSAHAYLGAPYGIYETSEGYLALAMGSVPRLGALLDCESVQGYCDSESWFTQRDEIKRRLAEHLRAKPAWEWAAILEKADYWCAVVQTLDELLLDEGFHGLGLLQDVSCDSGAMRKATRCSIRIDGERLFGRRGISSSGRDTLAIDQEFQL